MTEEALDCRLWRIHFERGHGPVIGQATEWMNEFFFLSVMKELRIMFIMWISDETDSFCGGYPIVQNCNSSWIDLFFVGFSTYCNYSYYMKMLIQVWRVLKISTYCEGYLTWLRD
jgi:hypothetical protein